MQDTHGCETEEWKKRRTRNESWIKLSYRRVPEDDVICQVA